MRNESNIFVLILIDFIKTNFNSFYLNSQILIFYENNTIQIQIVYLKSKQIDIHTGSSEKVGIAYCWDFGREYRNLI